MNNYGYIDSHCHLYDEKFISQENVINSFFLNGGLAMICSSDCLDTSKQSIDISNKNKNVYCTIGVHPHNVNEYNGDVESFFVKNSNNPKVVAIGEVGLDYFYNYSPKDVQKKVLKKQIVLASSLKLPCVFHVRDAMGDFLQILDEMTDKLKYGGVVHSFSGSIEVAKILLKKGLYLSFNGIITFKNANKILDVVKEIPLDKILIETDSPYLTPVPYRGQINEPKNVVLVAEKIAELKNISVEEVFRQTSANVIKLYPKMKGLI